MSANGTRRGEGPLLCIARVDGTPCTHNEIDGLEYCLWHMPDDLLDEAEALCGWKRCRHESSCHQAAVRGTDPPRCKNHGANRGSVLAIRAATAEIEGRVTSHATALSMSVAERLMSPPPLGNPLSELMELGAEAKVWKDAMREVVGVLADNRELWAKHSKVGDQLRAEVLLYERAIDRLASLLIQIGKMGIEARLAAIEHAQAMTIQRSLEAALQAATAGLPDALERQQTARQVLHRELAKVPV